jgi:hypothetical protein
MQLPNVDKKLREVRYFLTRMCEEERKSFGDKDPFDFNLSAFLNAARTVDNRLHHEQKKLYKLWRETWDKKLPAWHKCLMDFMREDRVAEVHKRGSCRVEKKERIPVHGTYSDASGSLITHSPPGTQPAVIHATAYYFTIDGVDHKATEVCAELLSLLEGMVAEFKAGHP